MLKRSPGRTTSRQKAEKLFSELVSEEHGGEEGTQ